MVLCAVMVRLVRCGTVRPVMRCGVPGHDALFSFCTALTCCWAFIGITSPLLLQVYEVTNDALMKRTCNRPLPTRVVSRAHALGFALTCGAAGLSILAYHTNATTTALGAANILLYAGVYTPLKQITLANTWVGAVVGAIPPLMGWASAAGQLEPAAGVLAAALFFWQMPHFMSLAWLCKEDYAKGGFRMLSLVDPTGRRTAAVALRHCLFLVPVGAAAAALGMTSEAFGWEAAALACFMGLRATQFYRQGPPASNDIFFLLLFE